MLDHVHSSDMNGLIIGVIDAINSGGRQAYFLVDQQFNQWPHIIQVALFSSLHTLFRKV